MPPLDVMVSSEQALHTVIHAYFRIFMHQNKKPGEIPGSLFDSIFLLELINTSTGIYKLLLPCKKGMALGADFNTKFGLR